MAVASRFISTLSQRPSTASAPPTTAPLRPARTRPALLLEFARSDRVPELPNQCIVSPFVSPVPGCCLSEDGDLDSRSPLQKVRDIGPAFEALKGQRRSAQCRFRRFTARAAPWASCIFRTATGAPTLPIIAIECVTMTLTLSRTNSAAAKRLLLASAPAIFERDRADIGSAEFPQPLRKAATHRS